MRPLRSVEAETAERKHRLFWQNEIGDAENKAVRALHTAEALLDSYIDVRREGKSEGVCVKPSQTLTDAAEAMRKVLETFYYGEAS